MQNNLLGSLFSNNLFETAYLCKTTYQKISFFKITYSKQLIYAKQLIKISFLKITYSKQLIQAEILKTSRLEIQKSIWQDLCNLQRVQRRKRRKWNREGKEMKRERFFIVQQLKPPRKTCSPLSWVETRGKNATIQTCHDHRKVTKFEPLNHSKKQGARLVFLRGLTFKNHQKWLTRHAITNHFAFPQDLDWGAVSGQPIKQIERIFHGGFQTKWNHPRGALRIEMIISKDTHEI